jgi:ElaB/YqjD/DUF883 family membrane-anchored ribosome-binding protein
MADMNKDDAARPTTPGTARSGSDTASAANISAGTSVGNAGQPATPSVQSGTGAPGTGASATSSSGTSSSGIGGSGMGSSGMGSSGMGSPGIGSSVAGGSSSQTAGTPAWARDSAADATRRPGEPARSAGDPSYRPAGATGGSAAGGLREQGGSTMDEASDWTREQYRQGARQLGQARDQSMRQLRSAQGGIERFATENPLMVGVMGLAAGLVIGALLPRTRHEDRAFGRWADEVREQGMRYARDATQRGREYVEEALGGDSDEDWRPEDDNRGGVRSSGPRYQNH